MSRRKTKENSLLLPVILIIAVTVFVFAWVVERPKSTKLDKAALAGDCNTDGKVDIIDFQLLSNSFGKNSSQTGYYAGCDFNGDNTISILDFQSLSNNFGMTASTGTPPPTSPTPSLTPPAGTVDASTMNKKFMFGYQGWFQTPCDGSASPAWRHWFGGTPPNSPLVDFWPDVSELTTAERCDTGLRLPNGQPAYLFSAYNQTTVIRHFQWMQQYGIDGVMLQRFTSELSSSAMFAERNKVAQNVRAGAEQTGRVFNIMWDITGTSSNVATTLINDWKYLVDTLKITESPRYLKQNGLPVVVIWGFGFADRPGSVTDLDTVLNFFHNNSNPAYRAFVMGGVNNDWRTNSTWASALTGFDAISPWMVGRISSLSGADSYKTTTAAELAYARSHNQLYMPVIFPGFSFYNQSGSGLNKIPRLGGNFVWRQAYNDLSVGATMLYGAMFDEVNEGTAFFKQAPTSAGWPNGLTMVPLNSDGYTLPSDWYLRVSGEITKMVRGTIPLSSTMTITPGGGGPATPLPTLQNTATPRPTVTPVTTSGASSTIVAVGDIACGADSVGSACKEWYTSEAARSANPIAVLVLGDTQYEAGQLRYFNGSDPFCQSSPARCYNGTWGRLKSITYPSVGNHEYGTPGAAGYFDYFNGVGNQTGRAGDRSKGYYSFDIGNWHLIALNSNCSSAGGCGSGSQQEIWLRQDLQNHSNQCTLAYFHHPKFSSGHDGNNASLTAQYTVFWQDLYNANADIILVGHAHDYERFAPQTPSGTLDESRGIREFVVGTGGRNFTGWWGTATNSQVKNNTTFGVLKLNLKASSYDWQFIPISGSTFSDSGSANCH